MVTAIHIRLTPLSKSLPLQMLFLGALLILLTCSCKQNSEEKPSINNNISYEDIDGFDIPRLETANEQLAFARASIDNRLQKIAAFKAVTQFFPQAESQKGFAALEIAYLQLGDDYRLARPEECKYAAEQYLHIAQQYEELPEIAAKALWYHGWILSDLLQEIPAGTQSYYDLIQRYSDEKISVLPPAPWTTMNLDEETRTHQPYLAKTAVTWGEMAYLELIRNTSAAELAFQYYVDLRTSSPHSALLLLAKNLLVKKEDITETQKAALSLQMSALETTQDEKYKTRLLPPDTNLKEPKATE